MANETTKTTSVVSACEQYVLEELKQAKKELEMVKSQLASADRVCQNLVNLIVKGTKGFRVIKDESPDYDYLYFQDDFITNIWKDYSTENEELRALLRLIDAGVLIYAGDFQVNSNVLEKIKDRD